VVRRRALDVEDVVEARDGAAEERRRVAFAVAAVAARRGGGEGRDGEAARLEEGREVAVRRVVVSREDGRDVAPAPGVPRRPGPKK